MQLRICIRYANWVLVKLTPGYSKVVIVLQETNQLRIQVVSSVSREREGKTKCSCYILVVNAVVVVIASVVVVVDTHTFWTVL